MLRKWKFQRHAKKLNRFHLNCMRKLFKIKWKDKIITFIYTSYRNFSAVRRNKYIFRLLYMSRELKTNDLKARLLRTSNLMNDETRFDSAHTLLKFNKWA